MLVPVVEAHKDTNNHSVSVIVDCLMSEIPVTCHQQLRAFNFSKVEALRFQGNQQYDAFYPDNDRRV